MRNNQPVTQRELHYPANATLMSTTDAKGRITYANPSFVDISGYAREALMGQAHNIIRHPDMPPAAFADMWRTVQAGWPWTGLVKNRANNGDHYWVRANVVPLISQGQITGYISVRTQPSSAETQQAQALYTAMNRGQAQGMRVHKGLVIRTGWMAWLSWPQTLSTRARIRAGMALGGTLGTVGLLTAAAPLSWMALAGLWAGLGVASWVLEAQVATPLEQLERQALDVTSGKTRSPVSMNRIDEIGMTLRCVNQMGLMFRWLIDDVATQVRQLQAEIDRIAQGNQQLNQRTEQSAAAVQQTATSMSQVIEAVQHNADTSRQATMLADEASQSAANGGHAVSAVISTMDDITSSSHRIADITGVIDSIAFQTNILALNASVEAARAGEQGKGFAVVAGEVRQLAQRTAHAAREIKSLIAASVEKVNTGAEKVNEASQTIHTIVDQVQQVAKLIDAVNAASQQQGEGIGQVNGAVQHMDQITQQNAALVEQTASASSNLKKQADQLVQSLSAFMH